MVSPSSQTGNSVLLLPTAPRGLRELTRASVRDAQRNARRPVATCEADVEVVELLPDLQLTYVQDASGTRCAADADTAGHESLLPGATFRALVNDEGYTLKIVDRLPG